MSPDTGMIVGEETNCHLVKKIRVANIETVIVIDFGHVKLMWYNRVTTMKNFKCAIYFYQISSHKNSVKNSEISLDLNWLSIRQFCLNNFGIKKPPNSVFGDFEQTIEIVHTIGSLIAIIKLIASYFVEWYVSKKKVLVNYIRYIILYSIYTILIVWKQLC